jgi:hypothetical protein
VITPPQDISIHHVETKFSPETAVSKYHKFDARPLTETQRNILAAII